MLSVTTTNVTADYNEEGYFFDQIIKIFVGKKKCDDQLDYSFDFVVLKLSDPIGLLRQHVYFHFILINYDISLL